MAFLKFNKSELVNLEYSLKREIILANKTGAYCDTTIVTCNTRRYHGLLAVPVEKFDGFRHILQLIPVIPDGVEQLHIGLRHRSVIHAVDHIVHIVAAFASQVDRCKSGNRHVDDLFLTAGNRHKRTHVVSGNIGFEFCLPANPVSALLSNRLLGHLIA